MTTTPPTQGESLLAVEQERELLLARMNQQIEEWTDDEPFYDWWTYQRDYAACRDILVSLASTPREAGLREALQKIHRLSRPEMREAPLSAAMRLLPIGQIARAALAGGEA